MQQPISWCLHWWFSNVLGSYFTLCDRTYYQNYILYTVYVFKFFYKSFLIFEAYLLLFCPFTKPSQITLILSTQFNIFLDAKFIFPWKYRNFFFNSLMKILRPVLTPSSGNQTFFFLYYFSFLYYLALCYENNIILELYKIIFSLLWNCWLDTFLM